MSITLARFSQEVDVANGSMAVSYFAVFRSSDGRELKLPISQTASQELISFMADKQEKTAGEEPQDEMLGEEELQNATTFGNDEPQDEGPQEEMYEDESPDSEEEVPSV